MTSPKIEEIFDMVRRTDWFIKSRIPTHQDIWELSKHVLLIELRARIDEIELNMTTDSERLNQKRITELQKEIENLEH